MNNNKVAAVWCRVSTHDQRELSLDSQEAAVRKALEAEGYRLPPQHVLKVDWTSLDLMGCPEFQQLRRWIAEGAVQAVGVLDRDRLQAQGLIPSYEASMSKAFGSELLQRLAATALAVLGPYGVVAGSSPWAPLGGWLLRWSLRSISATIPGGTTEVQRNIIATRGLGLPR